MQQSESQRIIDLVHRLAGSSEAVANCAGNVLHAQKLPAGRRSGAPQAVHDEVVDKIIRRKRLRLPEILHAQNILLPALRPAIEIVDDDYGPVTHANWAVLNEPGVRTGLSAAIRATCRIENDGQQVGTGFLVGDDLVMTNRHVASAFVVGVGLAPDYVWFSPSAVRPGVNFQRESGRPDAADAASVEIAGPVMMHPYFDVALLRLKHPVAGVAPLQLSANPLAAPDDADIALIGYPAHDPDDPDLPPVSVISKPFGVKRLQPGKIKIAGRVKSYDKLVDCRGHDSSTLNGSSGSPVIDLASGRVIAVHFYGGLRNLNWAVRASDLACDPSFTDAGVSFDGAGEAATGPWDEWWRLARMGAIAAGSFDGTEGIARKRRTTVSVTIPITLQIDVTAGRSVVELGNAR